MRGVEVIVRAMDEMGIYIFHYPHQDICNVNSTGSALRLYLRSRFVIGRVANHGAVLPTQDLEGAGRLCVQTFVRRKT